MRAWVGRLPRTIAWVIVLLLVSQAATPLLLFAAASTEPLGDEIPIATVVDAHGSVSVIRDHGTAQERIMSPVKNGLWLYRGDQIWTGENSWIEVQFEESTRVRVDESSRVVVVAGLLREIDPETDKELPTLRLLVGRIWVHVAEALSRFRNFSVETPSAIAGVRGTIFMIEVGVTGRSVVSVYEGVVAVASPLSPQNELLVGKGEEVEVLPEQVPSTAKDVDGSSRWLGMQEWLEEQAQWKTLVRQGSGGEGEANGAVGPYSGVEGSKGDGEHRKGVESGGEGSRSRTGIFGSLLDFLVRLFGGGGSESVGSDSGRSDTIGVSPGGGRSGSQGNGSGAGDGEPAPTEPGGSIKLPDSIPVGVPMLPRVFSLTEGEVEPHAASPSISPASDEPRFTSDEPPAENESPRGSANGRPVPGVDGNRPARPGIDQSERRGGGRDGNRAVVASEIRSGGSEGNQGVGLGAHRGLGLHLNLGNGHDDNPGAGAGGKRGTGDDTQRSPGPPADRGRETAPGIVKRQAKDVHDGSDGEGDVADSGSS